MLDAEKKAERERTEAAEKAKRVGETMNILTWQTEQRKAVIDIDKDKRVKEQAMLKTQWKAEEAADAEGERQRFILNRERNIELINHNANEKELKGIQLAAAKARDKELLDAALAREQALIELEDQEKQARRQEVIELQKHYKKTKGDKAHVEKEIDEFVQAEADR